MSSISISCFAPNPPPIRGLITRMFLTSMPMSGASMRRVWNGTWVAVRTTMRSSASSHAIVMCGSIGTCCTWCTRKVRSNTCGAASIAAFTSPRSASK